jgi:hypothetical protein
MVAELSARAVGSSKGETVTLWYCETCDSPSTRFARRSRRQRSGHEGPRFGGALPATPGAQADPSPALVFGLLLSSATSRPSRRERGAQVLPNPWVDQSVGGMWVTTL